jgi:hypothetical protein
MLAREYCALDNARILTCNYDKSFSIHYRFITHFLHALSLGGFSALWHLTYLIPLKLLIKPLPRDPDQFRCLKFISPGPLQCVLDTGNLELFNPVG